MSENRKGFTLVEIMLVVGIIGMLAPLAVLSFTVARERSRETACLDNRRVVEGVEQQFRVNAGRYSTTLYELIDKGYVKWDGLCPSKGIYAWVPYAEGDARYHSVLGCSIHGASSLRKSPLGLSDDFDDLNADGWTQIGKWQVTAGGEYASYGSTTSGYQRSYIGDQKQADYDISAKAALATGSRSLGLFFRMTYNEKKPQQANGYALVLQPSPTRADPNRTLVTVKVVKNGQLSTTLASAYQTGTGGWKAYEQQHELRMSVQGGTFVGYADGKEVIRYTDTQNRYPTGAAGLGVDRGSATFDDFKVTYQQKR